MIQGEQNNKEITVFEGFLDYLTFKNIDKAKNSDYLILNSTVMLFKAIKTLGEYDKIYLFLDNDSNGNITKNKILTKYKYVEDCSLIYRDFKDLNEWFCQGYIE
ncbi:toprim domain-containing protein [Chryseobacterium wanjuense]